MCAADGDDIMGMGRDVAGMGRVMGQEHRTRGGNRTPSVCVTSLLETQHAVLCVSYPPPSHI